MNAGKKIRYEFDEYTEEILLDYIRKNIYSKYPKNSLKKSSLIKDFKLYEVESESAKLKGGVKSLLRYFIPLKTSYELYYKDDFITRLAYKPCISIYIKYNNRRIKL
jgi:hypothetical protein